jgi:hypothetical protein
LAADTLCLFGKRFAAFERVLIASSQETARRQASGRLPSHEITGAEDAHKTIIQLALDPIPYDTISSSLLEPQAAFACHMNALAS